jgi:threonine dehydratase
MLEPAVAPNADDLAQARHIIAEYLRPTPTVTIHLRGRPVYAKMESFQPTGSFKIRGGLAAVGAAHRRDPRGAVITSSAGNHGLGVSHASSLLGVQATVVVPVTASPAKVKKLQNYDIELIQWGSSYDEAQAHAIDLAEQRGLHYISPFNDTHVMAGQATVFDEMFAQVPDLEHIVIPVGGGGLVSGMLFARARHGATGVHFTGAQPENSAAMYHFIAGVPIADIPQSPTVADGLAGGGDEGSLPNDVVADHDVPLVVVPELLIRRAVREAAETNGLIIEGSAATPYAAITNNLVNDEHSRIAFIVSGRNISHQLFNELYNEEQD